MIIINIKCNTIIKEANTMRKFKIPVTPKTSTKTIRFPDTTIKRIEDAIKGTDCSFSAFVIEACNVALDNLDEEKN